MSNQENTNQDLFGESNSGASFSICGNYRYSLWRIWDESKPLVMCIGLNPSTANRDKDDTTIRYLKKMLPILGYGGFYMMNCWAFISSNPTRLLAHRFDKVPCDYNNEVISLTAQKCTDTIFCWGNFKLVYESGRDKELIEMFPNGKCFGFNKNGTPFHPLAMMPRNGRNPNKLKLFAYGSY